MKATEPYSDDKTMYRIAFWSAVLMLVIIPLQVVVFVLNKIPVQIDEWYTQINANLIVGIFHSDFFLMVNNILLVPIYLGLYGSLKKHGSRLLQLGIILGFIGITAYISSNKTFELITLAANSAHTVTPQEKDAIEIAGRVMLLSWQGTSFNVYYVLNAITLILFSIRMFSSEVYGKPTATMGLISGVLMSIPSTAGTIGLIFSLLSLIPWVVFSISYARVFLKLSKA